MDLINPEDNIYVAGKGMVGSAIIRSLRKKKYNRILNPDRSDLDLFDQSSVSSWFSKHKPDVVIVAAARVGGILANSSYPADFILENLKIQTNIIETAWKYKVKRLLFLGSSCIYPKYAEQPITEEALLTGPLEGSNEWYAIAKIAGLKLCTALRIQYGFDAITLMPTNLYGPGDNYNTTNSHVLPALIRRFHEAVESNIRTVTCWGSGTPQREFLHVDDLGEACVYMLEKWDPSAKSSPKDKNGNILTYLNVGSGKDIKISDLANLIAEELNFEGEIIWDKSISDGTPLKLLDINKIKNMGWQSKITLRKGIRKTIESYKYEKKNNLIKKYRF